MGKLSGGPVPPNLSPPKLSGARVQPELSGDNFLLGREEEIDYCLLTFLRILFRNYHSSQGFIDFNDRKPFSGSCREKNTKFLFKRTT